jgi:hypothetical protein
LRGFFARRKIALQRLDRGLGARHEAQDRDPVSDLGILHGDRCPKLLLLTHHVVGRHLAEVAREHRVPAALVDGLGGCHRLQSLRRNDRGRRRELEVVIQHVDVGAGSVRRIRRRNDDPVRPSRLRLVVFLVEVGRLLGRLGRSFLGLVTRELRHPPEVGAPAGQRMSHLEPVFPVRDARDGRRGVLALGHAEVLAGRGGNCRANAGGRGAARLRGAFAGQAVSR